MWSADIFISIFCCIFVRLNSLSPRKHTVRHFTLQIAHRHVCLIYLAIYCKTAASLSGWKRTKYAVCEMAQNPLEVSVEVPITDWSMWSQHLFLSSFCHAQAPPTGWRGHCVNKQHQGQKTGRTKLLFPPNLSLKFKFQFNKNTYPQRIKTVVGQQPRAEEGKAEG